MHLFIHRFADYFYFHSFYYNLSFPRFVRDIYSAVMDAFKSVLVRIFGPYPIILHDQISQISAVLFCYFQIWYIDDVCNNTYSILLQRQFYTHLIHHCKYQIKNGLYTQENSAAYQTMTGLGSDQQGKKYSSLACHSLLRNEIHFVQ